MIQIYCGDGKGKTTAAVGQSVRAAGHGIPVLFVQFLKDDSSGEIEILKQLPTVQLLHGHVFYGFTNTMTKKQLQETKEDCSHMFDMVIEQAGKGNIMIVLDEIFHACNQQLLKEERVLEFLDMPLDKVEIVMTGRNPSDAFMKRADYISNIQKTKHPFDKGIAARIGIEM